MLHLATISFFFLIIGILSSVSLIGLSQILIAIPTFYFTFLAFKKKQISFSLSTLLLLGFTLTAFLSLMLNHSELLKPSKNYGQLKYLLMGVFPIWLIKTYMQKISSKTKKYLLSSGLVAIILIGFISIYQVFVEGQPRAKTLTDTLRYGYGMGMILPVLMGVCLQKKFAYIPRRLLICAIFFGVFSLYLTFTRGALLGLICSLPFVIYFWNKKKGLIAFVGSGLLVSFLGSFYLFGSGELGNRFISSRGNSSDNVRYTQWEAAFKVWKEKPFLGIGYSDFINKGREVKNKYGIAYADYKGHAHNIFLEILSGTGIIGVTFFLAWIGMWTFEMWNSSLSGIAIPFIVSMFVSGQFEVILDANNASLIFGFYALTNALKDPTVQPL